MRSGVKRNYVWRPALGVIAIGLIAFGLSLQGAPAGDDARAQLERPVGEAVDSALGGAVASAADVTSVNRDGVEIATTASIVGPETAEEPGESDGEELAPGQGGPGLFQPTAPSILPPDFAPVGDEVSAAFGVSSPSGVQNRCLYGSNCGVHVAIGGACGCDIECDDQHYCNGREKCEGGFCVAGAPINPQGQFGCLEREDMPNGLFTDPRGNYKLCESVADCETFDYVNCTNPQVCIESNCVEGCTPGVNCSEHCLDNDRYEPGQKFCFDSPGAGGDFNICTYMGHGAGLACTTDAQCVGLVGTGSVCLLEIFTGVPGTGVCSCLYDGDCLNGDCNEATGVCRTTGYECFEYEDPPLHPTAGCYEVIGTCCLPGALPADPPYCVYSADLKISQCNTAGGTWISDRQPAAQNTDEEAGTCSTHCPRYSSGVRYAWNANGVPDEYSFPSNGQGLCLPNAGTPCYTDANCVVPGDTCNNHSVDVGPVVMDPCNGVGFLRIGDDYTLAGGSYIALERFGFVGGGDHGNSTVAFEFYDNDSPPKLVTEFSGLVGSGKGYYGWGNRANPLHVFIPQAIIPPQGWVVIRSGTPEREGVHPGPLHWFSIDSGAVQVGSNNPDVMWVNDAQVDLLGSGSNVLRFEIRGVPVANEGYGVAGTPRGTGVPAEACCDNAAAPPGNCTNTLPWECMVCSNNTGRHCVIDAHCWSCTTSGVWCVSDAQCDLIVPGDTCDKGAGVCGGYAYLGQADACVYNQDGLTVGCGPNDGDGVCQIMGNSWPGAPFYGAFEDEYPEGYCYVVCEEDVTCMTGACCHSDGSCTEEASAAACTTPSVWQGYGTTCDPNCCAAGDQGGEFCWDAVPYILDVPDDFDTANVYNIVTTTADGHWPDAQTGVKITGHGPVSGQCEYKVCLDPATYTGSGVRCIDDAQCIAIDADERCVHKPCATQAELGDVLACAAGYCESDGVTKCRDLAGDCPVEDDKCVDYEVCERLDGGDPAKPSMAPDALRWEAFYLPECGYVTVDYCCTDDNPNDPLGTATPWNRLWPECVNTVPGDPDRKKICEGLRQADSVPGNECTDDDDCAEGTCTGGAPCHDDNDCPLGVCTGGGGEVCRVAGDCPAGETCVGPETCAGGQRCEDRRSFLGDNVEQDYPPQNTAMSSYGWWCADGNWANAFELPAGTYYLPIRAQKQCSTNFADCRKDADCQNEGVCQVYHHEYHLHLTVEKCVISACCELGGVCAGTDANDPANACPGTYYCEDHPEVDCTAGGDFDCTAGTCSVSGGSCHADYVDPVADEEHKDDDCPAGEQCIGYERCIATNCDDESNDGPPFYAYLCSDSPSCPDPVDYCDPAYAGDNTACTAGICTGGGSCHDIADCPPGLCNDGVTYCYVKEDCPGAFPSCAAAQTCTGGSTCDPVPCEDAPLCKETDRPTCEEKGGWWNEGFAECEPLGTPDCENVCFDGACCYTDPEEGLLCNDTVYGNLEACMNAVPEGSTSQFIPGATCAEDPCPVCPFADEDHCQFFDIAAGVMSTCDRYVGRDFMCADDFAALTGGPLERICWWPGFAPTAGNPECSDPGLTPAGDWTLRVFEDLGGIPDEGAEMGPAGGQDLVVDIMAPTYGRIWQYSAPVGEGVAPITLIQDDCYWLEISGLGESDCVIYWAWSNKGNQYSMQDYNIPDYPHYTSEDANNTDYSFCLNVGIKTEGLTMAGCANTLGACCLCPTEMGIPGPCTEETLDDCGLLVDSFGNPGNWSKRRYCNTTPPTDPPPGGDDAVPCETNADCTVAGETCQLAVNQCDPNPCAYIPQNDLCVAAVPIFHEGGDHVANPVIETYYDNRCTDTEAGAPTNCQTPPAGDMAFDLWYRYTVPACGLVIVETCESLPIFDGFGAIYRIKDLHTAAQPADSGTHPACCGSDAGLVFDGTAHDYACNDDGCGAGGPWHYQAEVGHGYNEEPPFIEELLVRVGAWWDGDPANIARARDTGTFTLEFVPGGDWCEGGEVAPPLPAAYPENRQRNRYLAFDPNPDNAGISVKFKVTLTDITIGSCDGSGTPDVEGWPCRTDADCKACSTNENPCWTKGLHCEAGETCDLTGAVCLNDHTVDNDPEVGQHSVGRSWWVGPDHPTTGARLLVTQSYAVASTAWESPVVVADCEVVPTGVYDVVTVTDPGGDESAPLEVKAAAKPAKFWADCVAPLGDHCTGNWRPCTGDGDCPVCYNWVLGPTDPNNGSSLTPCASDADCDPATTGEFCGGTCILQWPPPDGFINFQDINAAVFTFSGLPTVTPTDVPNIDLHGGTNPSVNPPNYLVNFNDIGLMVQAFAGWPYPYSDPGDCPDVAAW